MTFKRPQGHCRSVLGSMQAGCEAAVHAVRMIYEDPSNEAVLLIDATNAFNTLNRNGALLNVNKKCLPTCQSVNQHTTLSSMLMVRHYSPRKEPPKGTPHNGYVCHRNSAINLSTGPTSKTSVVRRRCHCRRNATYTVVGINF